MHCGWRPQCILRTHFDISGHFMASFLAKRILATIPVMVVVAFFVFSLLYITPGDPARIIAGEKATPEQIAAVRIALGLDQPFLLRFASWFFDIIRGDLGHSVFSGAKVSDLIAQRAGPTSSLMLLTLLISTVVGVPMGILSSWKARTWIDRLAVSFSVLGFSIPVFVTGYALAYIFSRQLQWLPVQGYRPLSLGFWVWFSHLILPALSVSTIYIALIARITRATMLEVLSQDYIRTARAKGLPQQYILYVHALKNASVPIVTAIGIGVALLIGGAVVTESVFAIPGLGRLTLDAILQRDYPVIQGVVLMFSMIYVLVNLGVDLIYRLIDPRIRY